MEKATVQTIINRHNTSNKYSCGWRSHRGERYEDYRKKWHNLPMRRELSRFPLHLDMDIISSCNLRCVMCAQTILRVQGTLPPMGAMSLDFVKKIIDQGATEGLASIKFNFQGEPLLHPELSAMVAYAKESGIVDTSINTNGTLLNREKAVELLESGIDNVFFSIDSNEPQTYERIRVGARLKDVIANIRQFLDLKRKLGKHHVQTGVNMVVLEENRHEIQDMKRFWKGLVDTFSWGIDQHSAVLGTPAATRQVIPNFCCSQLWQRMFIVWDGTCLPCCMDSRHELVVGNAYEEPVVDIWQKSAIYQHVRAAHQSDNFLAIPLCRTCSFPYIDEMSLQLAEEYGT